MPTARQVSLGQPQASAARLRPVQDGETTAATHAPSTPRPAHTDSGQITAFVVAMMAALVLLAGLVLDGGLTLTARERALGEAQEAARAGAQAINLAIYRHNGALVLNPAQAAAAAHRYLAGTGDSGSVQVTGNVVTVTVSRVQPMQILDVAGLSAVTVHATASAVPERGIVTVIP